VIIDCHAHFDPRILSPERVLAKMDAAGVERVAIIPPINDPLPGTPKRLLAFARSLSRSGMTRWLVEKIHRSTLTKEGNLKLSGQEIAIYPRPDNEGVAGLVAAHPDRFYGWIFLNPRAGGDVLEELERWRAVPGMVGIKLHPHWHDYTTDLLDPLLKRAEELRMPALIHLGFGKRGDFRAICAKFPELVVISAHAGVPFYGDLWRYEGECPNLYVDLSSPYIDEALARDAVKAMGPERCLYGTDAPYGFHEEDESYDYGEIKGWVERMPVSATQRDAMFGGTFAGLLAAAKG
jgi:predicted TIM-barrel fold metal-dependent hydrolase